MEVICAYMGIIRGVGVDVARGDWRSFGWGFGVWLCVGLPAGSPTCLLAYLGLARVVSAAPCSEDDDCEYDEQASHPPYPDGGNADSGCDLGDGADAVVRAV